MDNPRFLLFPLFCADLLVDCYFIVNSHQEYRLYSKTLLAPLLLIAIDLESINTKHQRSKILVNFAFFFCFIGDLLLLDENNSMNFLFGLTSFIIAYLFFIVLFIRLKPFSLKYPVFIFVTALIIVAYFFAFLSLLWKNLSIQDLEILFVVYAVIMGFMILSAINLIKKKSMRHLAISYFIPGALLFVVSVSVLVLNKFYLPINYAAIIIIITYGASLFFLAGGIIRFLKK